MKRLDHVQVPDEFFEQWGNEDATRLALQRMAVVEAVRAHRLSRGQGARMLGSSLWDFDTILAQYDVPTLDLTAEELDSQTRPLRANQA